MYLEAIWIGLSIGLSLFIYAVTESHDYRILIGFCGVFLLVGTFMGALDYTFVVIGIILIIIMLVTLIYQQLGG